MTVLIIILVVCNIVMIAGIIGIFIVANKDESKEKKDLKHDNDILSQQFAFTAKYLFDLLNSKLIKYKGKMFEVKRVNICSSNNNAILVELVDKIGFTKVVDIKDLTIIEKE